MSVCVSGWRGKAAISRLVDHMWNHHAVAKLRMPRVGALGVGMRMRMGGMTAPRTLI